MYDVILLSAPEAQEAASPAETLAAVLSVDVHAAEALIASVPCIVRRAAPVGSARTLSRELLHVGATVEVRRAVSGAWTAVGAGTSGGPAAVRREPSHNAASTGARRTRIREAPGRRAREARARVSQTQPGLTGDHERNDTAELVMHASSSSLDADTRGAALVAWATGSYAAPDTPMAPEPDAAVEPPTPRVLPLSGILVALVSGFLLADGLSEGEPDAATFVASLAASYILPAGVGVGAQIAAKARAMRRFWLAFTAAAGLMLLVALIV